MKFRIEIETDNAEFTDDPTAAVTRALASVIARFSRGIDAGTVRDINGNAVGDFELTP